MTTALRERRPAASVLEREAALAPAAFAAASIAAAMCAVWLASGVHAGEVLRFGVYQAVYVLAPGLLLYRALWADSSRLRTLVFGWTLGYLLGMLAFLALTIVDARGAFTYYPLAVIVPAFAAVVRAQPFRMPDERAERFGWTAAVGVAGVAVAAIVVIALWYFAQAPLPRDADSVRYHEDTVWVMSLVAETLHHWPITLPQVAGQELSYHLLPFLHMAGAAQVTDVDVQLIVLRLYVLPLLVLFVLGLVLAGRQLRGSWTTGIVAAALTVFVGEVFLASSFGFQNFLAYWLFASHSYLFGLVFFVAALALVSTLLATRPARRHAVGAYALVALFVIGALGSKGYATATVLAAGAGAYAVAALAVTRRVAWPAVVAAAAAVVFTLLLNVFYFEWSTEGGKVKLGGAIGGMPAVEELRRHIGGWPARGIIESGYATVGFWGAPVLVGLTALLVARRFRPSLRESWPLCLFLVTVPALYLLAYTGWSQMFVCATGLVAGSLVAAAGLEIADRRAREVVAAVPAAALALPALAAAFFGLVWLVALDPRWSRSLLIALEGGAAILVAAALARWRVVALPVAAVLAAGGVVAFLVGATPFGWLVELADRARDGRPLHDAGFPGVDLSTAVTASVVGLAGAGFAAGLIFVLVAEGRRSVVPWVAAFACGAALLFGGILGTALKWAEPLEDHLRDGTPMHDPDPAGLTAPLYRGLDWIRRSTPQDSVLAVVNWADSKYFYFSALTERRVVLESWDYTPQVSGRGLFTVGYLDNPFQRRACLQESAVLAADPNAIAALSRSFGVDYLVLDRRYMIVPPRMDDYTRTVFRNAAVAVFELPPRPLTYTPGGAPRLPGYYNPQNPFDTGRPNEANKDHLQTWLADGGRLAPTVADSVCANRRLGGGA